MPFTSTMMSYSGNAAATVSRASVNRRQRRRIAPSEQ
jgi:hypothetical protein